MMRETLIDLTQPTPSLGAEGLAPAGAPACQGPAPAAAPAGEEASTRERAELGTTARQRSIGDRLRRIRQQQRLSLADVEQRSGGEWKAVVVGAYERGDRTVTISRLARLAAFYGVPLPDLLPAPTPPAPSDGPPGRLVLALPELAADGSPVVAAVVRFADHIQRQRGDFNGRVLTIRGTDVQTIALAVGTDPEVLVDSLRARGAVLAG